MSGDQLDLDLIAAREAVAGMQSHETLAEVGLSREWLLGVLDDLTAARRDYAALMEAHRARPVRYVPLRYGAK